MTETANVLLERIIERLEEELSSSDANTMSTIEKRAKDAVKLADSIMHSVTQYRKNPDRYRPQLGNIRNDAKVLERMGRVILKLMGNIR